MPACAGLLELAENFIRRLSWSIFSHFVAIQCINVQCIQKLRKNSLKTLFGERGSRSFKVIDVDKSEKPVTSACYDKQHVCTDLQPFSHYSNQ